jgi:adenylate kinase
VLLGPPGAGKGTQARALADELGLVHLSTGDLLREHRRERTALGDEADRFMSAGELVPDETVLRMVEQRLTEPDVGCGVIFDGFPRTVAQARALDVLLAARAWPPPVAVELDVPREEVMRRLTGRRVCRAGGHTYHLSFRPPVEDSVCDVDGSELYRREDDDPETVARRIEVYETELGPLRDYYATRDRYHRVSGSGTPTQVRARLRDVTTAPVGQRA